MVRKKLEFMCIREILIFTVLVVNSYSAPTRKDPAQIPEAPFTDGCRILINEIQLHPQSSFLELSRYCKEEFASISKQIDLGKYALLVVDEEEFIFGYCQLSKKFITNGRWFYLVADLQNADLNLRNCQWDATVFNGANLQLPWQNSAFGLFLIRNERSSVLENFSLVKTGTHFTHRKITASLSKTLLANLQDLYILASPDLKEHETLGHFEKYFSLYNDASRHVIFLDFNHDESKSISRCGVRSAPAFSLPFQPQLMKITVVSPGRINECLNAEPPTKKTRLNDDPIRPHDNLPPFVNPNAIPENIIADANDEEEFEKNLENMPEFFWKTCDEFPQNKIKQIQNLPFTSVAIADVLKQPTCTWIDFIMPTNKFICKKCRLMLQQGIINDRKESGLITDIMKNGALRLAKDVETSARARRDNARIFSDHLSNPLHEISEQYFQLFSSGLRNGELQNELEKEGGPYRNYYKATENVVLATIQAIKMNIPFRGFHFLTETLDYFGAHIGHLYRTPQGARMISDVVGQKLHKDLISQLLKLNNDLSITLDSTTDIAGYGLLGVVFQTFNETGHVNSYLYRIMTLPQGEKGDQLFTQFMESIEADGLTDYIKKKTVALSTDGHPAVRSVFRRLLNNAIENELIGVWCAAHVLELIASKAFEVFPYLVEVDTFVNRIFRLLTAKSPLRREEFRKQIPLFGFRLFEFKRVRKLRWLAHHVRALSPFIFRYKVLVGTLEALAGDRKHNIQTRQEAQDLLRILKDTTFVATIAFTADVLSILAELSNEYQRINNTPIGKKFLRDQLLGKLSALQNRYGQHVMYLIEHSEKLRGNLYRNPLLTFESSHIKFDGVIMNNPDPIYEDYRLSSKMEAYVDAILFQVEEYYPGDILDKFDVLYAKRFPAVLRPFPQETYGRSELVDLNRKLKWNYDEELLLHDWHSLLMSLYAHPDFVEAKNADPETFWTKFLQSNFVEWSPITKQIVQKALTIPASSAQPERIFSMYSYVKTYQRYNLLPSTVENMVRIRFSPKTNIQDWNLLALAKEVISENHSRADDKSRRRTWKKVMEELEVEDEGIIDELIHQIADEENIEDEIFEF